MSKVFPCIFVLITLFACQKAVNTTEITQKVISLQAKAQHTTLDSTAYFLKKAAILLQKYPFISDSLQAENTFAFGTYYRAKNEMDSAATYFYNTTKILQHTKVDSRHFYVYYVAFETFKNQGKYGDCMALVEAFKEKINLEKDPLNAGYYHFFLEEIYKGTFQFEKALKANEKRIEIIAKHPELALTNHQELLNRYRILDNLNRSEEAVNILDALIKKDSLLTYDLKRQVYSARGIYDFYQNDLKRAIYHYKKSLENVKRLTVFDKNELLANSYSNIAEAYIIEKEFAKAQQYLDSAKGQNFEQLPTDYQRNILTYQLRLANEQNEATATVEAELDRLLDHQNNAYRKKYESELLALKTAAAKEKLLFQQQRNTELKNIRLRNGLFLVFSMLFLIVFGGILYYRTKKLRFQRQHLQMQQRLLRSQMNPHFTSNVLYSIQNTIKHSKEEAKKHLLKFSRLLRIILENSTQNYIQFDKEIDALKKYMDFQLLRFPKKFHYEFHYENMHEDELIFIPPMLLQPFIENSIEHGFSNIDYTGLITLRFTKKETFILCEISDNGSGFSKDKNTFKNSTSIQLIQNFIKKATRKEISISTNTTANTGVLITLAIPYKLSDEN
ncbi:sensor histidine kinase YpdA [Kordia sp. SMS9]|uniref:tetratricopeptide repeat-containing sensor histidine kinase n=1 Tax=Kordia sp. SMS9 TaxID=2282170 RepID=UPI000E0CCF32|nr:histidine kinase [Kordia sp. SMS9]AXG70788.1 sensor histidine kinase YpdA [Kordia sp. SMS9]